MAKTLKVRKVMQNNLRPVYTDADVSIIFDDKNSIYVTDNSGKPLKMGDILEFNKEDAKPYPTNNKLFYAKDTKKLFYCTDSSFVEIGGSGGSSSGTGEAGDYWGKDLVIGADYGWGKWTFGKMILTRRNKLDTSARQNHGDIEFINNDNAFSGITKKSCVYDNDNLGLFANGNYNPSGNGSTVTWENTLALQTNGIILKHKHSQLNTLNSYDGEALFDGEGFSLIPSSTSFSKSNVGIKIKEGMWYDPMFFIGTEQKIPAIKTKETLNITASKGLYINGKKYPEVSEGFLLKQLGYGYNPDTITDSGFYYGQAFVGTPYGSNVTCVLESFNINSAWIIQRLQALGAGEIYTRSKKDGAWDTWQLIISRQSIDNKILAMSQKING